MSIPRIYLIDKNPEIVDAWSQVFPVEEYPNVKVMLGNFLLSMPTEAIVSPANSFGIMDGGVDILIADAVGYQTVDALKHAIKEEYFGELPVGQAIKVDAYQKPHRWLISAPTMRVPENVSNTLNAYLAFRAVLRSLKFSGIESVSVPGLCGGIGGMSPRRIAGQMRVAYDQMNNPVRIPSYESILDTHKRMQTIV